VINIFVFLFAGLFEGYASETKLAKDKPIPPIAPVKLALISEDLY
jgi:hypothetical protein